MGVVEVGVVEGEGPGEAEVVLVGYREVCYSCCGVFDFRLATRWASRASLHSALGWVGEVVGVVGYQSIAQTRPSEKVDGDGVLKRGLGLHGALPGGHEGEVLGLWVEEIL